MDPISYFLATRIAQEALKRIGKELLLPTPLNADELYHERMARDFPDEMDRTFAAPREYVRNPEFWREYSDHDPADRNKGGERTPDGNFVKTFKLTPLEDIFDPIGS